MHEGKGQFFYGAAVATVLITAPKIADEAMEMLLGRGMRVLTMPLTASPDDLASRMAAENPDAVISRTVRVDAHAIMAAPRLKVISKYGVGFDNIDIAAATARGVPVTVTRDANSQSVAELTIGLMLALSRRVVTFDRDIREGRWDRISIMGVELSGGVLGVVGFGAIGRRVAPIARAIGMRVHAFDPLLPEGVIPEDVVRHRILEDLLSAADVVSLHCPLDSSTRGLIDADRLALMKPSAMLVNAARGPIVDERALVSALKSGRLAGAALDTYAVEPLPATSELRMLGNVVMTPHIGGTTAQSAWRVSVRAVQNVLDVLDGRAPDPAQLANPEVLATTQTLSVAGRGDVGN
jgi:D-3-phosphoglycerate dehydrogenase